MKEPDSNFDPIETTLITQYRETKSPVVEARHFIVCELGYKCYRKLGKGYKFALCQ